MRVSRWVGGLAFALILVVSCSSSPESGSPTNVNQGPPKGGYIEPPMLAPLVAAGKLPPISQRLPEHPFVLGPGVILQKEYMNWQDGRYGGTINVAATFPTGFVNIAGGATILRSPSQTTGLSAPNIVSDFSHSTDFTTFKFTVRKGLKWSDGQPVTTDDVRFTFQDLYGNADVQRPWPTALCTQGNCNLGHADLNVLDQYTFELKFGKPYGYFVAALNSWIPYYDFIFKPAHYLKQFHAKYADPATLAKLVSDNHTATWAQLLNTKDVVHWDIGNANALGFPVLNAWVLAKSSDTETIYERNPYFWHVDQSGHQLPYIDRVVNNIVANTDAQANAVLAGQVTLASGGEANLNKMPLYQQNAKRSNLHIFLTGSFNNPLLLFLNHDYDYKTPNSVWQQLVSDPQHRFGRAIAAATDPADINKTVYFGLYGKPIFNHKVHDPALAKQLLDDLGMKPAGTSGFRLGPDGKPFRLRITHPAWQSDFDPVAELLKQEIEAVGIQVQIERILSNLFGQRVLANEVQAAITWDDGPAWASGISADYHPADKGGWSPATWLYYTTQGKQGRQPPSYIQTFYDLDTSWRAYPPEAPDGQKVWAQIFQWMQDDYVFIPTAGKRVAVNVVDARLKNVPNQGAPFELDTYINAEAAWFAK